jgi:hypothetical protein
MTDLVEAHIEVHERNWHEADEMAGAWIDAAVANPWHGAPERFGDDPMMGVIAAILDVALSPDISEDANERLVRAAAAHGDQRRLQGIEKGRLFGEYKTLKIALRNRLRDTAPIDKGLSAAIRVEHVVWVARSAALQGYHRSDRGPNPSWAIQMEAQIAASSTSLASLFPHADIALRPAHLNGRSLRVRASQLVENGRSASAAVETVPDLLVNSLPP